MTVAPECQPCENFREENYMYNVHECPLCGGRRRFCENCATDHHDGGWQTCNHNPKGGPRVCGRNHPACIAAGAKPREDKCS